MLLSYLLLAFVLSTIAAVKISGSRDHDEPAPLPTALEYIFPYAILCALLLRPLSRTGGSIARLLGPPPDAASRRWALEAAIALTGVAFACLYVVYLPLSYVAPDFVESWILDDAPTLVWTSGEHRLVASALGFVSLVILGPFVEELLFRGLLLPAWAARWGTRKGILFSSLVFALLHPGDPLGAFVFGAVLATAFLIRGTLWLPFLAHAAGNFLVWILILVSLALFGEEPWTVAEFRAFWWWGLAGLLVGAPLLVRVLRTIPGPRRLDD